MPFLVKGPGIKPGSVSSDIVSNVDFAPTWLDYAGLRIPSYMQGDSFKVSLLGARKEPQSEDAVAYHRYWMHREATHNSYVRSPEQFVVTDTLTTQQAHYGIRTKRYKLIFWYNQGFGLEGTQLGGEEQEWELFDCDEDPMELFNIWPSNESNVKPIREHMVRLLEDKMFEIGDFPAHPTGLNAEQLRAAYAPGMGIAARAEQHNM